MKKDEKDIFIISSVSAFLATLCCFSPIVLVIFGLTSISFAAGLGNRLFFGYWWAFISGGLLIMGIILLVYFRKKHKICSLDEAKRKRKKILNIVLLAVIIFVIAYVVLEVIIEIVWIKLGLTSVTELKGYFG